jgi:hypothetical protein
VVTIGHWHHVALTADETSVTLYFDGATDPNWTINRSINVVASNPLRFGDQDNFGGLPYDGLIDEVRFFDRALDAAEVQAVFNAGTDGNCRPCVALPPEAVAWWRAEDNGDDAVSFHNGLPDNGTAFIDGMVDRSFDFDGVDDVVRIPDNDLWDFGTSSFALSAWFKSANATGYHNIIRFHNGAGASGWGLRLEPAGLIQFRTSDVGAACTANIASDSAWDDDEWHHVVAVRDAAAGQLRLYVDGVADATPVSDGGCSINGASDNKLGIGAGQWGSSSGTWEVFNGPIDEVGIFLHALTESEVQTLFNAQTGGACGDCADPSADQITWWRGEGTGYDNIGGHHGTAMNNAAFSPGLNGLAIDLPDGGDFVEIPHHADLAFGPTDPMSIELWAFRETDQDAQHVFSKRFDCFSTPWNYQMVWQQSTNLLCFGHGSDVNGNYVCTTQDKLPLQEWTHLAVTFDGSIATLFVNADPVASKAIQLGTDTNSPPLRFGSVADCDWVDQGFTGLLDEIQLYDRALTRSEILASHTTTAYGRCPACFPYPTGLAAWWRGEGDPTDVTGNNDGTMMNGGGYGSGKVGRAFNFDDDAAPDYIEVPHSASLDITGAFTAEGWIRMDDQAAAAPFIKGDANGSQGVTSYGMSVVGGQTNISLYGSYPADLYTSTDTIGVGDWHHIAVTWDGSTSMPDNVNLYFDGALAQSWSKTTSMNSTGESVTIGAMKPPTYHHTTDGSIDELAIYDRELSAMEIAAIVSAGSSGKCGPPDTVPDPFSFDDQIDVVLDSVITSNAITVSGIDAPTNIGITSCTGTNCEYSINGGGWTATVGIAVDGDMVQVRQTSSPFYGTTTDLTLDIGTIEDTFSVTTWPGHTLTVILAGIGRGSVTSDPAGINCPDGACFFVFAQDEVVTLTPVAKDGSAFAGWSGPADCSDGQVTITADINCTATFDFLGLFADGFETGDTSRWDATSP